MGAQRSGAWRIVGSWLRGAVFAIAMHGALAQPVLFTLVDGEASVVDGARRFAAAPGLRIGAAAIVETSPGTLIARIEWPDQSSVDLGPATRVMILPPGFAPRSGRLPVLYLLQGWAKVTGPDKDPAGGVVTPAIELLPFIGAAVVAADRGAPSAFAESGPLEVMERVSGRRSGVAPGALYIGAGRVEPRPTADWLAKVPRTFRDPLPRRYAALVDRPLAPAPMASPTYAALADWLAAEPTLRLEFPRRFEALAQDAAFRRELQTHLAAHPEWARVLNPDRKP